MDLLTPIKKPYLKKLWSRPKFRFEAVKAFQAIEADGVWHLLQAYERTDDSVLKSKIFEHIVEEFSHADEFVQVYEKESQKTFSKALMDRGDLGHKVAPLWKTLAYVHVGEVDATENFRLLEGQLEPTPLKSALQKIINDEEGHIGLTEKLAHDYGVSPKEFQKEVNSIRRLRRWEQWKRLGLKIMHRFNGALLIIVYYVAGWPLSWVARRLVRTGVNVQLDQIKRF